MDYCMLMREEMGAIAPSLSLPPERPRVQQHYHDRCHPYRPLLRHCPATSANLAQNVTEEPAGTSPSTHGRRHFLLQAGAGSVLRHVNWPALAVTLGLGLDSPLSLAEETSSAPDYSITDKVYLDITKCPSSFSTSRESGQGSSPSASLPVSSTSTLYCSDGERLGRIVIGLYGKQVPETVANFKAMCTGKAGSSYRGTLIHRVLAGQYILAGKQGSSKEKGEVLPPKKLDRNLESVTPQAFAMHHARPGTVSLSLSENDDEDQFKLNPEYRNVEFLITTGPGPAPQLDNKNIVFGTVLEGLDVVTASAMVPTYKPSERIRQFNELASFLGDERASNARSVWYRPLKALYISDCGEL